jgi:NADH-quinone oxidoreductase subunit C
MKTAEEIYNLLKEKFNDKIIELNSAAPVELFVVVDPLTIHEVCFYLRDDKELQFNSLMNLSGVDNANGEKKTETDGSTVIAGGTLSVVYHLESTELKHKIVLKVFAPRENPDVESVSEVWRCADWHEREAYDLIGINFLNHPDLRRILMPYDWNAGYPLRKDYKNPEFYHGMKVPY